MSAERLEPAEEAAASAVAATWSCVYEVPVMGVLLVSAPGQWLVAPDAVDPHVYASGRLTALLAGADMAVPAGIERTFPVGAEVVCQIRDEQGRPIGRATACVPPDPPAPPAPPAGSGS